jgi:predicted RecB family nuclease
MRDLASFQDAFQRAIVDGDEDVLEDIAETPRRIGARCSASTRTPTCCA